MQTKIVRRGFPGGTVVKNLPMQKKKKNLPIQSNEDPAQSKREISKYE